MNCAARLVSKAPLLADLHWLPEERGTEYKIATIYNVITYTAPLTFITSLNCTSHHTLSAHLLIIAYFVFQPEISNTMRFFVHWFRRPEQPPFVCATRSNYVFLQVTAKDSPFSVRHAPTMSSFKSQLKTHFVCATRSNYVFLQVTAKDSPFSVRHAPTMPSFKSQLKTHLSLCGTLQLCLPSSHN